MLARAAKAQGVKNFVHVSALAADPDSPSRWAQTKVRCMREPGWVGGELCSVAPGLRLLPSPSFFPEGSGIVVRETIACSGYLQWCEISL